MNPVDFCKITIQHEGTETAYTHRKGLGFQALCMKNKTPIDFDCRQADCGICIVNVLEGGENLSPVKETEQDFLNAMRADPTERLSCQTRILGDVKILVET